MLSLSLSRFTSDSEYPMYRGNNYLARYRHAES